MSLLGLENRASRLHGRAELTILGLLGLLFCELLLFLTSETKGFINIHTHTHCRSMKVAQQNLLGHVFGDFGVVTFDSLLLGQLGVRICASFRPSTGHLSSAPLLLRAQETCVA